MLFAELSGECIARSSTVPAMQLFVVSPHPQDFYDSRFFVCFIDQPMLNIDTTGINASQIAHQFLIRRRRLEGIQPKDVQQVLGFGTQPGRSQIVRIFLCLSRVNDLPRAWRIGAFICLFAHQGNSDEHCSAGVFIPSRMDSRMPGMDSKYNVSSMDRQSSSETRTALVLGPLICTGSWDAAVCSSKKGRSTCACFSEIVFMKAA